MASAFVSGDRVMLSDEGRKLHMERGLGTHAAKYAGQVGLIVQKRNQDDAWDVTWPDGQTYGYEAVELAPAPSAPTPSDTLARSRELVAQFYPDGDNLDAEELTWMIEQGLARLQRYHSGQLFLVLTRLGQRILKEQGA